MRKLHFLSLAVILTASFWTPACAQGTSSISGTWFGSIALSMPDGTVSHDTAVLVILQGGTRMSGSMGRTIDQQTSWTNGRFENNELEFHLDAAGGLDIHMTLLGGSLAGGASGQRVHGQIELKPAPGLLPHQQLEQEIMMADRRLYKAFENCDVSGYASFLSKDLEFYQDRTGKTGYEENLNAVRDRCAEGIQLRRELDEDTLIVNASPGFGAIEAGTQRFYSKVAAGKEQLDATARFTNVWSKESGTWKLVRVISYDHR